MLMPISELVSLPIGGAPTSGIQQGRAERRSKAKGARSCSHDPAELAFHGQASGSICSVLLKLRASSTAWLIKDVPE